MTLYLLRGRVGGVLIFLLGGGSGEGSGELCGGVERDEFRSRRLEVFLEFNCMRVRCAEDSPRCRDYLLGNIHGLDQVFAGGAIVVVKATCVGALPRTVNTGPVPLTVRGKGPRARSAKSCTLRGDNRGRTVSD